VQIQALRHVGCVVFRDPLARRVVLVGGARGRDQSSLRVISIQMIRPGLGTGLRVKKIARRVVT